MAGFFKASSEMNVERWRDSTRICAVPTAVQHRLPVGWTRAPVEKK
jgi:hypothetical protein